MGNKIDINTLKQDSWANLVNGTGVRGRDKAVHGQLAPVREFTQIEVENLYRGDAIARRIVDSLPCDAVANWFDVAIAALTEGDEELDAKQVNALAAGIQKDYRRLFARSRIKKAGSWDRLYGGSIVVMVIDDGLEDTEPVDLTKIKRVVALHVMHRYRVTQGPIETDPESPHFGLPESYTIHPRVSNDTIGNEVIHADRVLRFQSSELPEDAKRRTLDGWGDSVYQQTFEALMDYQMAHRGAASLISDFAQPVWTIPGLAAMLAAKKESLIQRRFAMMDFVRGTMNAIFLDGSAGGSGEKFERVTTPVTGLPELLDRMSLRLSAATAMSLTKLFGTPPKGFATEDVSGDANWDDLTKSYQEETIVPQLERLTLYLFAQSEGPSKGQIPASWETIPNPLEQPTEQDIANVRKTVAETDALYVDRGVLTTEEVADSRYTTQGWSMETTLDRELREEMKELEEEAALKALEEPDPVPPPPPGEPPAQDPEEKEQDEDEPDI